MNVVTAPALEFYKPIVHKFICQLNIMINNYYDCCILLDASNSVIIIQDYESVKIFFLFLVYYYPTYIIVTSLENILATITYKPNCVHSFKKSETIYCMIFHKLL